MSTSQMIAHAASMIAFADARINNDGALHQAGV
jgi:hypothetical protein